MPADLTDDEWCVLRELHGEHTHPTCPHDWLRGKDLSGPIGKYQQAAFRGLLRKGLVERKRGPYANRNRRWMWRYSPAGTALVEKWDLPKNWKQKIAALTGMHFCGADCDCGNNSHLWYFTTPRKSALEQTMPAWLNGGDSREIWEWLVENNKV